MLHKLFGIGKKVTSDRRHVIHVLDRTGDTETIWRTEVGKEVSLAEKLFKAKIAEGYMAYTAPGLGVPGELITEFDPTAEKIIMTPRMVGG